MHILRERCSAAAYIVVVARARASPTLSQTVEYLRWHFSELYAPACVSSTGQRRQYKNTSALLRHLLPLGAIPEHVDNGDE